MMVLLCVLLFAQMLGETVSSSSSSEFSQRLSRLHKRFLTEYKENSNGCDLVPPFFKNVLEEVHRKCGGTSCIEDSCDRCTIDLIESWNYNFFEGVVEEDDQGDRSILNSQNETLVHELWMPVDMKKAIAVYQRIISDITRKKWWSAYGNDEIRHLLWVDYFSSTSELLRKGVTTGGIVESESLEVFFSDLQAWQGFYSSFPGLSAKLWNNNSYFFAPCECPAVRCREVHGKLRITAIVFVNMRLQAHIPSCIGEFTELEILELDGNNILSLPLEISKLTKLRILTVSTLVPLQLPLSLQSLGTTLERLDVSAGSTDHHAMLPRFQDALVVCSLKALKVLMLIGFKGSIPDCIGDLTELRRFVTLSNQLSPFGEEQWPSAQGQFLPSSLGKLENLRVLYAFHNGEILCPPKDPVLRSECRSKYSASGEFASQEPAWSCRTHALTGPIPDSYQKMTKIEKFWVDANFINGPVPHWIGEKWLNIRSIDFFDNNFTGPIPENFVHLRQLEQLQIQRNDLGGSIPSGLALLPNLRILHVALNEKLGGCLPLRGRSKGARVLISGTQIVEKEECHKEL